MNSDKLGAMDKTEYTEQEALVDRTKARLCCGARARDYGVDLSETVHNLRLTLDERVNRADNWSHGRIPQYSDVRAGYDYETAALLELEAILEYQQVRANAEE